MDPRVSEESRERSRRPIRNKRYNRRTYSEEKRPPKRLFTPEIKRFLKDWLIRRRDNPYPNRDEKKTLAIQTGLTYIQVCNWFANWRRKLKNSGKETQRKSWGYLIKSYNDQVHGNVEHFSICSEDSIWQEAELNEPLNGRAASEPSKSPRGEQKTYPLLSRLPSNETCFYLNELGNQNNNLNVSGCYPCNSPEGNPFVQNVNKYKSHIMEKYLRDCQKPENYINNFHEANADKSKGGSPRASDGSTKPSMMSKWLESAANFRPNENNYLTWTLMNCQKKKMKKTMKAEECFNQLHGKEELDAAEALTRLANAQVSLKI